MNEGAAAPSAVEIDEPDAQRRGARRPSHRGTAARHGDRDVLAFPAATDGRDLEALEGVAKFPVRVKCALLAWNVLQEGIDQPTTAA